MKNRLELSRVINLVCDNEECNYVSHEFPLSHLEDLVGTICPLCQENLLTQEDVDKSVLLNSVVNEVNSMSEEEYLKLEELIPNNTYFEEMENYLKKEFNVRIINE